MGLSWSCRRIGLWSDERSSNVDNWVLERLIWDVTKISTISDNFVIAIGQKVGSKGDSKSSLDELRIP